MMQQWYQCVARDVPARVVKFGEKSMVWRNGTVPALHIPSPITTPFTLHSSLFTPSPGPNVFPSVRARVGVTRAQSARDVITRWTSTPSYSRTVMSSDSVRA